MIDILIPVLNRPHLVQPLLQNLADVTSVPYRVLFLPSANDIDELQALDEAGASYSLVDPGRAEFTRKINHGFAAAAGLHPAHYPYVFMGADDLRFHYRWDTNLLAKKRRVVGTNDKGNPEAKRSKRFSTHVLIARSYIKEYGSGTLDNTGLVLSEAYDHNWCDRELSAVAISRGEWQYAEDSIVEHLHPHWGKADMDSTYKKGIAAFNADRRVYQQRMKRQGLPYR